MTMDHPSPVRTIDLGRWRAGSAEDRATVAAELDASLQEAGFVVVVGHGVPEGARAAVRAAAMEAFRLPQDVKDRYRAEALATCGWVPFGMEANSYASGEPTPPDLKETWVLTTAELPGHDDALPNVWPDEVPAFAPAATHLLAAIDAVHLDVLRIAAQAIGVDDTEFFVSRSGHVNTCNVNWYPPLTHVGPPLPGQWRIGPHTDFGTVTVLDRQPGLGGLQVQLTDGTWVDAPWVEGSLVVNCGDLLQAWSNGRWRSAPHRVLPPSHEAPDESLVSIVYFCEPDPAVRIEPLPGVGDPDGFEPFVAGDYMAEKLAQITVG
jgi:isopenicillin N synthase-like dioxygenase